MIYTVTLNPSLDYIMYPQSLKVGETNRSEMERVYAGGKGINVSVVLKNLGIQSVALGFTAGFTGDVIVNELQALGLCTDFICLPNGMSRINVKLKGDAETEINGNGPDISTKDMEKLYTKLDTLKNGDILVLAGSIPRSLPDSTYEDMLSRLSGKGIEFVVDASGSLLVKVLKYKPLLIKPNLSELCGIFGKSIADDAEITDCAGELRAMGARNVLVSLGGDGSLLLDENGKVHRISGIKGKVIDTVGAGDSMVAGFIAGYLEKSDLSYAARLGAAAGTATAFSEWLAGAEAIRAIFEKI